MVKHRVILRGYGAAPEDLAAPPLIAKRTEAAFVPALLEDLRKRTEGSTLGKVDDIDRSVRDGKEYRRLFQAVHRAFNLVVLEAVCDAPGHPRIHPTDIASSGFVVRQVASLSQPVNDLAWQLRNDQPLGWARPDAPQLDPAAEHRRPLFRSGHPGINRELSRVYAGLEPPAERTSPLFLAPPEICTAAGRTLLYGVIPVTSPEEVVENDIDSLVNETDVRALLPPFLVSSGAENYCPKGAPGSIFAADIDTAFSLDDNATGPLANLRRFLLGLRSLQFAWRVFDGSEAAKEFRAILDGLYVAFRDPVFGFTGYIQRPQSLGSYLDEAAQLFLLTPKPTNYLRVPEVWPYPDKATADRIVAAALALLRARHRTNPPRRRRFADDDTLYRIHAFIRTRHSAECPPVLDWSAPSEPFCHRPLVGERPDRAHHLAARHRRLLQDQAQRLLHPAAQAGQPPQPKQRQEAAGGKRQRFREPVHHVDLLVQYPDHHDLRLHRAEHHPTDPQSRLLVAAFREDLPAPAPQEEARPLGKQ
jgi:hypothetical protein